MTSIETGIAGGIAGAVAGNLGSKEHKSRNSLIGGAVGTAGALGGRAVLKKFTKVGSSNIESLVEVGGLGVLALPSIQALRGKPMSDHKAHKFELAGLGILAAPYARSLAKGLLKTPSLKGLVKKAGWFGFEAAKKTMIPNRIARAAGSATERAGANGVARRAVPQLTGLDKMRALSRESLEATDLGSRRLLTKTSSGFVGSALALFEVR